MKHFNVQKISKIILPAVLGFFLLFNAFFITVFNNGLYSKQFRNHNVYEALPDHDVDKINGDLLKFLGGEEVSIGEYFDNEENIHLRDVAQIFKILRLVYVSLLAILILFLYIISRDKEGLYLSIKISFFASLGVVLLLLCLLPFFEEIFIGLHLILFNNEYWMLDPAKSVLIKMFPIEIFYYITIRIFLTWFVFLSVLFSLASIMKARIRSNY